MNDRPLIARVAEFVRGLLAEPSTGGLDPDSLDVTLRRRELIQSRDFLRRLYQEWYAQIGAAIPQTRGAILEIGSGGGFVSSAIPEAITSDVLPLPGVDVVLNAERLPFADGSLRAVVMTNVFHHIPDVARFLGEFKRCASVGGALVMIEPWVTAWSRRIYGTVHSEPFDPAAQMWTLTAGRPLSCLRRSLDALACSGLELSLLENNRRRSYLGVTRDRHVRPYRRPARLTDCSTPSRSVEVSALRSRKDSGSTADRVGCPEKRGDATIEA